MSSFEFKVLCIVINFLCLSVDLSEFFTCPYLQSSKVSDKKNCSGVYSFYEISAKFGFILLLAIFSHQLTLMVFHKCPRDSKSTPFSKTLFNIQADIKMFKCMYHLIRWSNSNFLQNFQWITFPIQLCLVLYSFCASLLYSLI